MNRRQLLKTLSVVLGGSMSTTLLTSITAKADAYHHRMNQASDNHNDAPYIIQTLDQPQLATIATITDIIIPRTNTPGATDVNVPLFIDLMLSEWYEATDKHQFLKGLGTFTQLIYQQFKRNFIDLPVLTQHNFMKTLDLEVFDGTQTDEDLSFFYRMTKELTLIGYYTSTDGMEQELDYLGPIGEFDFSPSGPPGSFIRY